MNISIVFLSICNNSDLDIFSQVSLCCAAMVAGVPVESQMFGKFQRFDGQVN